MPGVYWQLDVLGGIGHRIIAVTHAVDFLLAGEAARTLVRGAQALVRGAQARSQTLVRPDPDVPAAVESILRHAGAARRRWLRLDERCVVPGDGVLARGRASLEPDPSPSASRGYRDAAQIMALAAARDVALVVSVERRAPG